MQVCILTTGFPRFEGDLFGAFVLEMARALVARGVRVVVIASISHHRDVRRDNRSTRTKRLRSFAAASSARQRASPARRRERRRVRDLESDEVSPTSRRRDDRPTSRARASSRRHQRASSRLPSFRAMSHRVASSPSRVAMRRRDASELEPSRAPTRKTTRKRQNAPSRSRTLQWDRALTRPQLFSSFRSDQV